MKNLPAKKSIARSSAGSSPSLFIPVLLLLFLFVLLLPAFLPPPAWGRESAALRFDEYVLDQTGLLRAEEKRELNSLLADFDQKTTNQFLVVILPSLPPATSLKRYSLELAEAAKAGRAGKDNGLLLLILRDDRKIRIEVGTGLEEKITDGRAGRVIREILTPAFQRGEYYSGIKAAMLNLINRVAPSYAPAVEGGGFPEKDEPGFPFLALVILVLLIIVFSRFDQKRLYRRGYSQTTFGPVVFRHRPPGGFGGFGGGGFRGGGGGFRGGGASGGW